MKSYLCTFLDGLPHSTCAESRNTLSGASSWLSGSALQSSPTLDGISVTVSAKGGFDKSLLIIINWPSLSRDQWIVNNYNLAISRFCYKSGVRSTSLEIQHTGHVAIAKGLDPQ